LVIYRAPPWPGERSVSVSKIRRSNARALGAAPP
jgi:hypothetical protein